MENTQNASTQQDVDRLLAKAKSDMAANMESKSIAAIIWDLSTAGFHYTPQVVLTDGRTVNITGLYHYSDRLYLIEEDNPRANIDDYYDPDNEVRPTVICLSANVAEGDLGNPEKSDGFTLEGSLEEWLAIADCYFEALNEKE